MPRYNSCADLEAAKNRDGLGRAEWTALGSAGFAGTSIHRGFALFSGVMAAEENLVPPQTCRPIPATR
jgi:hypothetical protein